MNNNIDKKIISRSKFYTYSIIITVVISIIIFFSLAKNLGIGAISLFVAMLVAVPIFIILSSIIYEIIRYFFNKKVTENSVDNSSTNELQEDYIVGKATKFFSIVFFLSSILFLFNYLNLFIDNYRYVKLLKYVDNLPYYGLKMLSTHDIFTSFTAYCIYILFFISFLTIVKSFKNSKASNIFVSISLLFFIILLALKIFSGSHPVIYSGTYYQDRDIHNGNVNQSNAFEIIKTDNAIKSKDIKSCSNIGYSYFRDYCVQKISSNK